jgi:Xaa-Pro aminopeptidase
MLAGSDTIWYGFQLSSGADAHRGMGQMTGRTLAKGDQVQVDCGAVYQGYHGDFSRVTTVGAVSKDVLEIMETTAEMYEAMLNCLEPGVPIATVANASIGVARRHGMEDYLFRSPNQATRLMGHGIGCWYLEIPEVTPSTEGVIESNMVVVLEPILSKPGIGGAKIEDAVLVTGAGAERLSGIPTRTWAS